MYGINGAPAFQSRGISSDSSAERFNMSRPSARSIYMQRKEYSESMKRQPDMFLYRVEHLITCELDGREMGSVDDCMAKLKNLDSRGKVWGQGMILQVQNANLQLCDIETKEVLESVPLGAIAQTFSILDSCSYDSVLAVITQGTSRRPPNVLLFQCEEAGADEVKGDLERVMQHRDDDDSVFQPHETMFDIRRNLENIIGQGHPGGFHRSALPPSPPPPEYPIPQGNYRDYEDVMPEYVGPPRREEPRYSPEIPAQNHQPSPSPTYAEQDAEIFNHVAADIELFVGKVAEALQREDNKKKKKKKKPWIYGVNIPSTDEFVACLQKFKYAFNLLAKLSGHLKNPGPAEFVHGLFSSLGFVVKEYPPNLPSLVVSPLMIKPALDMLRDMLTPEEKMLWSTLGDAWHLHRSDWRNGDVPPYIPVFYDGWQPPMPVPPQSPPISSAPLSSNSQRVPAMNGVQQQAGQDNRGFGAPPARSSEPPLYMRVIYDFTARNRQELSVMKGEVVQVMDKSRQWWIVRNNRDEEGHVPQNVLEPIREEEPPRMNRAPNLNMGSSPEEVRAWLQYKGFLKSTVRTLGMMPGSVLLGMRREDIRAVCPEEGGRVCFQLQAVKSAMALASEGEYDQYGGR